MDVRSMFTQMAETGHAPCEGCHLFSVGYEDAIDALRTHYLMDRFSSGGCAEKLIVGPFGSGKTHFMRHFMEIARELDCVTTEVPLNRDRDFSQPHLIYREIVEELRIPGQVGLGLSAIIDGALDRIRRKARDAGHNESAVVQSWIAGLDAGFKWQPYGKVARTAFQAALDDDADLTDASSRWLNGDFFDRSLARQLRVSPVTAKESGRIGRLAFLCLLQLIRRAAFRGTLVGFDEAEQSFDVNRTRLVRIHSVLQSFINALADLNGGSALVLFALTPAAVEKMNEFPALQQRIGDPAAGQGFFDGNVWSVTIDLTACLPDQERQLRAMGERLVEVFCDRVPDVPKALRSEGLSEARRIASDVASEHAGAGARRQVAKRMSAWLLVKQGGSFVSQVSAEPEV